VAGEAGIGKTRLVQELVKRAPAGTLVLAGQADPGTVGRPLEVLLDALDGHTAESDPELLAAVHDAGRPAEERVRAGVDLVRRLTDAATGLVIFEDLHWADSESVTAFQRLAEPAGGCLVLVGTYRPAGMTRRHPASDALPRLDRRHSVTHVHLDRLGPADVSSFLTAVYEEDPSFRVVDALHSRSGGNPFFLEELVASSGAAPVHDLDAMPLPWTVAELVRSQLDAIDPAVNDMLTPTSQKQVRSLARLGTSGTPRGSWMWDAFALTNGGKTPTWTSRAGEITSSTCASTRARSACRSLRSMTPKR
jgi:AAA ATPase domain